MGEVRSIEEAKKKMGAAQTMDRLESLTEAMRNILNLAQEIENEHPDLAIKLYQALPLIDPAHKMLFDKLMRCVK